MVPENTFTLQTPLSKECRARSWSRLPVILLGSLFLLQCTRAVNPDIERGSGYTFRAGFPETRVSAIGLLNERDEAIVNVAVDIVYSSLIYRTFEQRTFANVLIDIQLVGQEGTEFTTSAQNSLEIESASAAIVTTQDAFLFQRELKARPGEYRIIVTVQDQTSGKQTSSEHTVTIPDPENPSVNITTIRLLGRSPMTDGSRLFVPVTTYDVPGKIDSLRFSLQITNNLAETPLEITSRLVRFVADTTPARPMQYNNYGPSSIPYKGIDYDRAQEVDVSTRSLEQPGSVFIEYPIGKLPRGNYRFEVTAIREGMETPVFKAREFSIKSENYPTLQSTRELAAPLFYLMDEKDYEKLMAIQDEDSLKMAIDRFWLSNVKSISDAGSVIAKYYQRVEEANKQFSNFKEGWKTDMGMIYILFGPPWYVERQLNLMLWSYSYDRSDPRFNYLFEQPKVKNEFFPFNNYLLQRDQQYYNVYYQQVQLWLTGQILTRDL